MAFVALAFLATACGLAIIRDVGILPSPAGPALAGSTTPLFDPAESLNESTLDVTVLDDWHVDTVNGTTRQKLIEITVAEWWPGQDYRIPVRMIVPLAGQATGFHITGGHSWSSLDDDASLGNLDSQLISGGVGVVHTVVRPIESLPGGAQLAQEMLDRFLQTHDLRYSAVWIWPMTLMRATTAAYAETGHFNPGKIAGSGGSKNGFAPAAALIQDERFTLTRSGVAPAYASPLRLYDQATMDEVTTANDWFFAALDAGEIDPGEHNRSWYENQSFGAPGDLHVVALAAGWTWEEVRQLTEDSRDEFYVAENWDQLTARSSDVLFEPGTHDWVAYDVLWGAQSHPDVPVYYKPNGGHDQTGHPAAETSVKNEDALILKHFFGGAPMLEAPSSSYELVGAELHVTVTFDSGPEAESGRIWWMYDRYPGGSAPFLWERIPDDQWMDMTVDSGTGAWTAAIPLDPTASSVEFLSNHGLVVDGRQTYLSSRYSRAEIPDSDGDGCSDIQEAGSDPGAGGLRDPNHFWDFYDVWTHPVGEPSGWERTKSVGLFGDIFEVAYRFGANDSGPGTFDRNSDPLSTPNPVTGDPREDYHPAFDRGALVGPNDWDMGPPDGSIDLFIDIFGIAKQFGHNCAGSP